MKNINYLLVLTISWMLFATSCASTQLTRTEELERAANLEEKINNRDFVFEARDVLPMGGRTRHLTSYYGLKIANDTLNSTLPYFGRAYSVPINPSEGGYIFTTTGYDYQTNKREDGWDITIVPLNRKKGERFILSAFNNGTANLQVNSTNRQPITFRGRIR